MVTVPVKRWTREDDEEVVDAGIFALGARLELSDEEVVEVSSQKRPHLACPHGELSAELLPSRSSTHDSGGT